MKGEGLSTIFIGVHGINLSPVPQGYAECIRCSKELTAANYM